MRTFFRSPLPRERDHDEAAAGLAVDLQGGELVLHLLHAGLHLAHLLHHAHQVLHR